jgi:hypothetical protein
MILFILRFIGTSFAFAAIFSSVYSLIEESFGLDIAMQENQNVHLLLIAAFFIVGALTGRFSFWANYELDRTQVNASYLKQRCMVIVIGTLLIIGAMIYYQFIYLLRQNPEALLNIESIHLPFFIYVLMGLYFGTYVEMYRIVGNMSSMQRHRKRG